MTDNRAAHSGIGADMQFQIKHRLSGRVLYECELSGEIASASYGVRLGFAVRAAVSSGADLSGADLSGAVLTDAVLTDAVLRNADLSYSDLTDAVLRNADLSYSDLTGAVLSGDWVPRIPNIHQSVFNAASKEGALDMGVWHSPCGTAHCRAGWVVTLAGDAGRVLEGCWGTPTAAAAIYMASDPKLEKVPDFSCDNDAALADMKRLAELEARS